MGVRERRGPDPTAQRVLELAKVRGLEDVKDLARASGLSESASYAVLRGDRGLGLTSALRILRHLNEDPFALLDGTVPPTPNRAAAQSAEVATSLRAEWDAFRADLRDALEPLASALKPGSAGARAFRKAFEGRAPRARKDQEKAR